MEVTELKSKFQAQLSDVESKIIKAKEELSKMEEYKTKLIGGLETLELLNKEPEEDVSNPS